MAARKKKKSAVARRYGAKGVLAGGTVQALLFPRDWSQTDAVLWASVHGYKTGDVDKTDSYIRIHQTRGKADRVKTIPFGIGGIRAVVEWR